MHKLLDQHYLEAFLKMSQVHLGIWISTASKDSLPRCCCASSSPLRAEEEQKTEEHTFSLLELVNSCCPAPEQIASGSYYIFPGSVACGQPMVGFLGLHSLILADLCNKSCLIDKFFWFYFLGSLADVVPYSLSMHE